MGRSWDAFDGTTKQAVSRVACAAAEREKGSRSSRDSSSSDCRDEEEEEGRRGGQRSEDAGLCRASGKDREDGGMADAVRQVEATMAHKNRQGDAERGEQ